MGLGMFTDPRHYIYVLCFFAFSFQVYHLYDQSYVNPIYTDTQIIKKNIQDIEFPVIFKICIQPGFDKKELKSVGYHSERNYFDGSSHFNSSIKGWAGHKENGNIFGSVTDIMNTVVTNHSKILKGINVWTKSKKWLTIPNKYVRLRKPNRPNNCLSLNISESTDIKKEGILQVFFFFNPVNEYNADILLEDKDRYCDRAIKSNRLALFGQQLKHHKLTKNESMQYIVRMKQTIFNENDSSKKCINYPTEKYENYNHCDESFMRNTFNEFYPPHFTPVWATDNTTLVTTSMLVTNNSYVDLADGTQLSDCPVPCRSTTFISSLIATEASSSNQSSIEITFEETVTVAVTDFAQFTLADFLATVGGSAGLWLGLGALQTLDIAWDFIKKVSFRKTI